MKAAGVPEPFIPTFVSFDANTREGGFDVATRDIEKLSGRAPQDLESFLTANKAALLG